MAYPCSTLVRENEKFVECPAGSGNVAVRTKICQDPGEVLKVDLIEDGETGVVTNVFNQITNVAAASPTTITTYTVPAGKSLYLKRVEASGSNRAKYTVKIAGSTEAIKRTYQPIFNVDFDFSNLLLGAGVTVLIEVEHSRTPANEFDARIIGNLV